ncbi:hypothetical protein O181_020610 [Austropuccinia psidii MF-1]|uniref:Uncharacterized protein n=1 Tax=Austropuccinia psidii MF-1 TaxID=1389203 RepID=A0A9Q3GW96_9BASI|nr:hypothetical protein [Austropuccinia psidii MF-1]
MFKKTLVSPNKYSKKEEFLIDKLVEAQINPSLSFKMRHELIDVLYTYKDAFSPDNEPLGAIKRHEVDITLNIKRPFPPVLRSPRAREALKNLPKS